MTRFVVDASVIVTYLINKNKRLASVAKTLIQQANNKQIILESPPFFLIETVNALRYNLDDPSSSLAAWNKILALPIKIRPLTPAHYQQIIPLSYQNHTTAYDTAYHVLAISSNATFLTCDQDYYKKSHHLGYIKLLG